MDTSGLFTPKVFDYLRPGVSSDGGVLRFLENERLDYLVILPNWYPTLAEDYAYFQPVHEITIADGSRFVAYRTVWADE